MSCLCKMMKLLLIVIGLIVGISLSANAGYQEIMVYVDGQKLQFPDQKPFINNNSRTLVPVRFVSEALGADVAWCSVKRTVQVNYKGKSILLEIDKEEALVDNKTIIMDTKAEVYEERTMVPLRFVSECMGATVKWEEYGDYGLIHVFTAIKNENEMNTIIETLKEALLAEDKGKISTPTYMEINPSGKMPDPVVHDAMVAKDKEMAVVKEAVGTSSGLSNPHGVEFYYGLGKYSLLDEQITDVRNLLKAHIGEEGANQVAGHLEQFKEKGNFINATKAYSFEGRRLAVTGFSNGASIILYYRP